MVVVFEGIDGAGKGTICQKVVERMGAQHYKSPPEDKRQEQDEINEKANDAEHYEYFVEVTKTASKAIGELSRNGHVVVDRYWMTTLVYHQAMGLDARLSDFGDLHQEDLTVYLTVTPEVQAKRLVGRGMSPGDKRMEGKQHLVRAKYDEALANCKHIRIDTSDLTPDEIVELIMSQIPLIP